MRHYSWLWHTYLPAVASIAALTVGAPVWLILAIYLLDTGAENWQVLLFFVALSAALVCAWRVVFN